MKLAVRAVESEGSVVSAKQELLPVSGEMASFNIITSTLQVNHGIKKVPGAV